MVMMREEDIETALKVVIVGNGAVGKSSMIQRYCKGIFTKEYKKTIGVDFLERQIQVSGEDVRLMLWDTAGQEEFDAITKAYYRGAQACVLVFSTTDRASYDALDSWRKKVESEVGEIPTVLVQNKIDLVDEACITNEESENLAKRLRLRFYRTSVKDDYNVNEVFSYLAESYLSQINSIIEETHAVTPISNSQKIGPSIFTTSSGNNSHHHHHHHHHHHQLGNNTTIQLHPSKRRTSASGAHHGNRKSHIAKCTLI